MLLEKERLEVCEYGRIISSQNMVHGTMGNLSVCNRELGLYAITPHDLDYSIMMPEDVVVIDMDGNVVDGRLQPSVEHYLHRLLYLGHEDFNAIIHTHSVYATAASCLKQEVPYVCIACKHSGGKSLPVCGYAKAGTPELAKMVEDAMEGHTAILMQGHGMVAGAPNLKKALNICTNIEYLCQVYMIAKAAGEPQTIL